MSVLKKLSEIKQVTLYVPALNDVTGSVESTLLLTQIYYWSRIYDHKRFYKNIYACRKEEKRAGQKSWQEELNFTRYQIRKSFDELISRELVKVFVENRTHKTYISLCLDKFLDACKRIKMQSLPDLLPISDGRKPPLLTVGNGPIPTVALGTIAETTQRLPESDLKLSDLKKIVGGLPEGERRKIFARVKNYLSKFKTIGVSESFKKSVLKLEIDKYNNNKSKNETKINTEK